MFVKENPDRKKKKKKVNFTIFQIKLTNCLAMTKSNTVILSFEIVKIENSNFTLMSCLIFSQEEVDTKALLHVLLKNTIDNITIRLPSGDINIIIPVIYLLWKFRKTDDIR